MTTRSIVLRTGTVVVLLISIVILWLSLEIPLWQKTDTYLTVTFLDVGQGDAILIETPDGVDVLVDGGADGGVLRELSTELGPFDRTLDLVVGTHPDQDHIGGLIPVLTRYSVGTLLVTEHAGDTLTASSYQEALLAEGAAVHYARTGQIFALGEHATLTVFSPARDPSMLESNTASIIAKITYGETSFFLTGDAPLSIEDHLVATYGTQLQSSVLKLGHHGSRTSTGEHFLQTVSPEYAVVSAGVDNRYGHPHEEVVELVTTAGIPLLSTAEHGSITFVSDGNRVWVD